MKRSYNYAACELLGHKLDPDTPATLVKGAIVIPCSRCNEVFQVAKLTDAGVAAYLTSVAENDEMVDNRYTQRGRILIGAAAMFVEIGG